MYDSGVNGPILETVIALNIYASLGSKQGTFDKSTELPIDQALKSPIGLVGFPSESMKLGRQRER